MATKPVAEAPKLCALCPRLVQYRSDTAKKEPRWFNGAVPSFGEADAELLIVGLAPGVTGANRTGRPFTGDYAGDLLYATLEKFGFSKGKYAADPGDGLRLNRAMITNAVRCVPPENKPTSEEINTCRPFLKARIDALAKLKVILPLGKIAHDSTLRTLGVKLSAHPFGHGTDYECSVGGRSVRVISSYHCSRYNTNTGVLTAAMFEDVFAKAREALK